MKAVLLHDWITGFRGGERVLEAFCDLYPQASLYTLIHVPGSASPKIENREIHTSFVNKIPGIGSGYRKFLPLFPKAAEGLKIDTDVELVLSSCHCVIKGVLKPKGSIHVSYIHSPMRYLYDQYDQYFGPQTPFYIRAGGWAFHDYLVRWDRASNKNVDLMIANSKFVRERIRKYYERDAEIVYPFVELDDFKELQSAATKKEDQYVMVTAFAPNKRVDLAIEAFNQLKKQLVIIGGGQLDRELRKIAGPTIRFLGNMNRVEVIRQLAISRALIFPGVEDFGITPLEALAAGTPVIAFRAGGVLETLTEEDSVFFDEPNAKCLIEAIRQFEGTLLKPSFERLQKFSRERFLSEMRSMINQAQHQKRSTT